MFKFPFALGLSQKFLLYVLLASIVPLLVVGVTALDTAQNAIRDQVNHNTQDLAARTSDMELMMQQVESLLVSIAPLEEINQVLDETSPADQDSSLVTQTRLAHLLSGYTRLPGLVSIELFTPPGKHYHVGDMLNVESVRTDLRDRLYAQALRQDQDVVWGGIQENVNANSRYPWVIPAAHLVVATDPKTLIRKPTALLVLNLNPDAFYDHDHEADPGRGAYFLVVDQANRLVYHSDQNLIGALVDPLLVADLNGPKGSLVKVFDGQPVLITYSRSARYGWLFVSLIPLAVLTERMMASNTALLIVLGSLILALCFALVMSLNVVKPLRQLSSAFQSLRDGNLDARPGLPMARGDEIGVLARGFGSFLDSMTARRHAETALRESEERYALAVRGANDGVWDWDLRTDRIYFSPRWKSMLGFADHEIGNAPAEWFDRILPEDVQQFRQALDSHIQHSSPHLESEYRIRHRDGEYRWMLCRGLCIRDAEGNATRLAGSQTDITVRKRAEERLVHDAMYDALTGLPNRALFMDRLDRLYQRFKRHTDQMFAVLFVDLDRFKVVNDSLGHLAGDELLVAFARRLENIVRASDTVARLGGDEFGILLDKVGDTRQAQDAAARILRVLEHPFFLGNREIQVTASIGIVLSHPGHLLPDELLRDADTALYRAKDHGRSRSMVFARTMHIEAVERLELEADIRRAFEHGEFELFYQPIVSLATGKITRVEALLRWRHPNRGLVSPAVFIPVAEETGLIVPIGEWGLRTACTQLQQWQTAGAHLRVSVNLSARQFQEQNLPELARRILYETQADAHGLEVEITERTAMGDLKYSVQVLRELNRMGVHISIDDFGESYSALGYLKRFPIDSLKIDRSFVGEVVVNSDAAAITSAIIAMAHQLDLLVVAEGVESELQAAFVRSVGCDEIQGYLVSRAVTANEVTRLLAQTFLRELPFPLPVFTG